MMVILIMFKTMTRGMPANRIVAFLRYVPVDMYAMNMANIVKPIML